MISFGGLCTLALVVGGILILRKNKENKKEIERLRNENEKLRNKQNKK